MISKPHVIETEIYVLTIYCISKEGKGMNDKQQLNDIEEVYNKLGKITQMDIQWLFEQVKLYHECREDALQLHEQNKRYKESLEFYANQKNYEVDVINQWEPIRPIVKDNGEKARHVLEKPYSQEDYEKAKQQNLDLDNWNDYVTYYELGEKNQTP